MAVGLVVELCLQTDTVELVGVGRGDAADNRVADWQWWYILAETARKVGIDAVRRCLWQRDACAWVVEARLRGRFWARYLRDGMLQVLDVREQKVRASD